MANEIVIERLFEALIDGDRDASNAVIEEQLGEGIEPESILENLLWPTYELVDTLYRSDKLTNISRSMAIRLLRVLADRFGERLSARPEPAGRTVLAICGEQETEELGAQMAVDFLVASGFSVRFVGGGVANDELLSAMHKYRPDVLLAFSSSPNDLPAIRNLIDTLHEIGACPNTQIAVGGGVFNRAEGIAQEIGADVWAEDPLELADALIYDADQRATNDQRTVGKTRRPKMAA